MTENIYQPKRKTFLYAAACGDFIKIGVSTRPFLRMKCLTGESSLLLPDGLKGKKCTPINVVAGTRAEEAKVHKGLSRYRRKGEWFAKECRTHPAYKAIFIRRKSIPEKSLNKPLVLLLSPDLHRKVAWAALVENLTPGDFAAPLLLKATERVERKFFAEKPWRKVMKRMNLL